MEMELWNLDWKLGLELEAAARLPLFFSVSLPSQSHCLFAAVTAAADRARVLHCCGAADDDAGRGVISCRRELGFQKEVF